MNSIRKTTALLTAFVVTLASLTAVTLSPALAETAPAPTSTASPAPTTTATATTSAAASPAATATPIPTASPSPSPALTTAPPATTQSQTLATPEPLFTEVLGGSKPSSSASVESTSIQVKKGAEQRKATTEAYSLSRSGDIKVRLVMVQLADRTAPIPEADARAAVDTSSQYWQAMSNGRLSMSVATAENRTSKATSTQSYSSMMNTIVAETGWVPSPLTAMVVFVSSPTLSDGAYGAGWSYSGTSGRVIMPLPASLTKSVLTHEFGHVLGLMHANRLRCGDGAVDTASNADGSFANSTCSVEEYKDNLDVMGVSQSSQPVISSPMYEYGGFGAGAEVRNLGKAVGKNSYQLKAWGSADEGRAVKFTDPISGEIYFLELRLPVGNDAATAVGGNRGVKVVQAYDTGSVALQPNTTTFSGYYSYNQAWQAGQTFTTYTGTRVTIDWISDSAAGVTIDAMPAAKPLLVAPGDFNGDGIADLIQRKVNGELWFYPGDGTGKSGAGQRIGTGWEIYDTIMGTGDFNGDGRNDLVARKFDGSLWFYAGTGNVSAGNEGYAAAVKIGNFGWDAFNALLGVRDFDGDGKPDILARRPDGVLMLYPGMGTGWPGTPRQIDYGWDIFDQLIPIQDFNGDGTNDLAARRPDGSLWLYSNSGPAKLVQPQQIGSGWDIYTTILGTGDANGDRTADIVASQADGNVFFYAGTAMRDEGYASARKIGDYGWEVFDSLTAIQDFNGDKIADLLARKPDGTLWFYPGDGKGAYGVPRKIGLSGWDAFNALVSVGDFTGDGKNDLVARKPDGTLWIYPGTGRVDATDPGYTAPKKIGTAGWNAFTALTGAGDLNGDGKNDVVARKFDGTLWMYPGDGTGKLSAPRRIGTGWSVFDTVLGAGNLTADSFPDLVARKPDGSLWAYSGTGMQPNEGYLPRTFTGSVS